MHFWKRIGIFFVYPLFFLLLGFWLHMGAENLFCPSAGGSGKEEQAAEEEQNEESREAAAAGMQRIGSDTCFVVKTYDLTGSVRTQEEQALPEQYLGMDREAFLAAMEIYESSPSLEDRNRGFLSLDVELFSSDKVVIRKNYESSKKSTEFYLGVENNYVVVYEADKKTKYMSTGIPVRNLPDELAGELIGLRYVANEEELYNFLESYTS